TRTLLDRFPHAEVTGVDSSAEMLERASAAPPRLRFVREDLRRWRPDAPLDLVVSNAALHWIPDHASLLRGLRDLLSPSAVLSVQVPNNYDEAAYRIAVALMSEPPWEEKTRGASPVGSVETAAFYREHLARLDFDAEVWETVYEHRMGSSDEIVEWLK